MLKKKDNQPALTAQELLEARVDAMMNPRPVVTPPAEVAKLSVEEPVTPPTAAQGDGLPPLDIFKDTRSAPEVPEDLLQKIDQDDVATPPAPAAKSASSPPVAEAATTDSKTTAETAFPAAETRVDPEADIDDAKSDAAIDDIVAEEGDEVLAAEDAGLAMAEAASPELTAAPAVTAKHHTVFWFIVLLLVIVALVAGYSLVSAN